VPPGYQLNRTAIAFVLGAVHIIAARPEREPVDLVKTPPALAVPEIANLPDERRTMVYTLQLRRAFGGMSFDMAMLNWHATTWARRFQDAAFWAKYGAHLAWQIAPRNPDAVPDLRLSDWELAAVDFHVSNVLALAQRQSSTLAALPLDDLKTAMWQLRSSTTNKRLAPFVPPGTADDRARDPAKFTEVDRAFLAAEPTLDEVARRILAQRK